MPQYLSPGVYVQEVPSAVKPIAGVSTSTACFIGIVPPTIHIPRENPKYDPTKESTPNSNQPFNVDEFKYFPPEKTKENLKAASDELEAAKKALAENKEDAKKEDLAKTVAEAEKKKANVEAPM